MNRTTRLVGLVFALALVIAACGDSTAESTTTTTSAPAATDAPATTATTPTETTSVDPTVATTTTAPATPGGLVELFIGAEDSEGFSKSTLEAPAGVEVSVTFKNDDSGDGAEPHNWHVIIEEGVEEYATLIEQGPDTQTVTFTVGTPGEYAFFCDTHPLAMKGTLVITP